MIIPAAEPYNALVRQYFRHPVHAGALPSGGTSRAEACCEIPGARVRLAASADGDRLLALRFGVYGCPHLIAAAEWACEHLEGRHIGALDRLARDELMTALSVPVEKTGRILLLEDTMRRLKAEFTG